MINNKLTLSEGGKRLAYLDALKCLGILLVISGHVGFFGMGIRNTYDSPSSLMLYILKCRCSSLLAVIWLLGSMQLGK